MAKMDAKTISEGRAVKHWLNALIHITASLFAWIAFGWQIGLAILFISRVTFDIALNLFRKLPIDYVSSKPASVIDQLEKKVFGKNGILPKIVYLIIAIVLNIWN